MSFTPAPGRADRSFELVRQSLLQSDELPFQDALTAAQIRQAFDAEGVAFGQTDDRARGASRTDHTGPPDIVYTEGVTLWAMLSQALFTDVQRACVAAVQRVAVYWVLLGRETPSTDTGGYTRARAKVTEGVVRRLAEGVAARCEPAVPDDWKWRGFRTLLIDGTTLSMPDTEANQEEYPQPTSQTEGLGFPIMRAVALMSLATGMVVALATGPYAGKETGETALFRTLFEKLRRGDELSRGDLVLADRYYGGWFMLALLQERGVQFVTRLHQHRTADFTRGKRLGKKDHIVTWAKPPKPGWLDQEAYDRLPARLGVRELEVRVDIPGFRTESLVVVTSLLDNSVHTHTDIAALYRQRWLIELHLRDIKSTMQLDILRRTRPEYVRQELWTGLLAYNLVRQSLLQSAIASGRRPHQLSFASALQMLANTWVLAAFLNDAPVPPHTVPPHTSPPHPVISASERLIALRILNGHTHRVGHRPNRVEPRAAKRRPSPLALLTELRSAAQDRLKAGRTSKS